MRHSDRGHAVSTSGSTLHVGRFALTRLRLGVLLALAVALGASSYAPKAMAAAEVHRLNLVLSGMPSQVAGDGMNDLLQRYNEYPLQSRGLEPLDEIRMGWMFDAELRYFVRPNFAVAAGVGYLKVQTKRSYMPSIGANIDVLGQVIAVPLHVGAAVLPGPLQPGRLPGPRLRRRRPDEPRVHPGPVPDHRDRAGRACTARTTTRSTSPRWAGTTGSPRRRTAPGYYAEVGAHLFFAARYSVVVGAVYRSMKISDLESVGTITVPTDVVVAPYLKDTLRWATGRPASTIWT